MLRRASLLALIAAFCATSVPAQEDESPDVARFDIMEIRVLGNTVLAQRDVESAVYPHLGPNRTIADVEAARLALELAYRNAGRGTVYVDIPEQSVEDNGVVRLKVTEGKLRAVRVEGARYFSGRAIRAAIPAATIATAPELPALQQQITALNAQTTDRSIVPVLAAGPVPGTVDLTLKVSDEMPVHGSVEVNDQYTADTSRLRVVASLSYDNLFNRFDSIALQYQTAPEERKEMDVLVGSYVRNIGKGRRLSFYYVNSKSDVASTGVISVLGKGQVFGSRLIFPLVNSGRATHSLTLGADYKDFLETINPIDDPDPFVTPISYVNLSLGHSSVWRAEHVIYTLGTTLNFGPRGGNTPEEFASKGFRARPNYFYVRANASTRVALPRQFSVLLSLAGQYAIEPVISNEQFAIGGADGVRGYLEAEELGDIGLKSTLQIESPAWTAEAMGLRLNGFAFFDAGLVSAIRPLDDEPRRVDLSSVGLGFGLAALHSIDAVLAWAYPLVPGNHTGEGDSRVTFSVRASW